MLRAVTLWRLPIYLVLFINVFGTWNGSFGINTAAGDPPAVNNPSSNISSAGAPIKDVRVFRFVPTSASGGSSQFQLASATGASQNGSGGTATNDFFPVFGSASQPGDPLSSRGFNFLFPLIGGVLGLSLLGAEKLMKKREELSSLREFSKIVFRGKL
jgi:hypothetical protein